MRKVGRHFGVAASSCVALDKSILWIYHFICKMTFTVHPCSGSYDFKNLECKVNFVKPTIPSSVKTKM